VDRNDDLNGLKNFISTKCQIAPSASLGKGVSIWQFASVLQSVTIGNNVSIGSCAEIGRGSKIGNDTRIGHGVFLPPDSQIGNNVFIGPSATFTDDKHPRAGNAEYDAQPPVVEDHASIGAGAVILPGVRIGYGAMIGAGAIVTRDVPAQSVVYGSPARVHA